MCVVNVIVRKVERKKLCMKKKSKVICGWVPKIFCCYTSTSCIHDTVCLVGNWYALPVKLQVYFLDGNFLASLLCFMNDRYYCFSVRVIFPFVFRCLSL